jgi:6-phosphogluconate dehydrogenase
MKIGMIGLGRMGGGMALRLLGAGHEVVSYARHREHLEPLVREGAAAATSEDELVAQLAPPRVIWLSVPAGAVDGVIAALRPRLVRGDAIVDAGNSRYHDDLRRARSLAADGLHLVDVGTSGGVWGRARGYCQMVGGEREIVERIKPILGALAPLVSAAPRTPGRTGEPAPEERGWLYCGPHGAGHFVKMVHNGIEYGLMAAYAEGMNILAHAGVGKAGRATDAETCPLEHPDRYQYDLDLAAIAEVWRRGSVISSWLLDLIAASLVADPALAGFSGRVADSGEGRWTLEAALDESVPAPILATALGARFASRGEDDFANRLLAAMRFQFGGHEEPQP